MHHNDIDCFYSDIISASHCIPSSTASIKPYNIVPGCNAYVKEHHLYVKDALGGGISIRNLAMVQYMIMKQ